MTRAWYWDALAALAWTLYWMVTPVLIVVGFLGILLFQAPTLPILTLGLLMPLAFAYRRRRWIFVPILFVGMTFFVLGVLLTSIWCGGDQWSWQCRNIFGDQVYDGPITTFDPNAPKLFMGAVISVGMSLFLGWLLHPRRRRRASQ